MLTKRCFAEKLTARDKNIFADLYVHKIMSTPQIGAIHAHSETHLNTVEQRLLKLCRAGYIALLETIRGDMKHFMLLQKGMNELAEEGLFPDRKIRFKEPSLLFRSHDLSVTDFTIVLSFSARDFLEPASLIDELAIFSRSSNDNIRAKRGWQVSISHSQYGRKQGHWVKPDKTLGIHFLDRPHGRNERYYLIEIDKDTMPLTGIIERPTILRKLLAYEVTIASRSLLDHFTIRHPYVLFIAPSDARRDNMIDLALSHVHDATAATAMLFAVQPRSPSINRYTHVTDMEWINGKGVQACFPM